MVKLGEMISSIYLVTKINKKGVVCEYLDITTGKRIMTSAGGQEQNNQDIQSLSEEDLEVLAETMTIEKYVFWKQGFQEFITRLCNVMNSFTSDNQNFHPVFTKNVYWEDGVRIADESFDFLGIAFPEDMFEVKLHKEQVKIKTKPEE